MAGNVLPKRPTSVEAADIHEELGHSENQLVKRAELFGVSRTTILVAHCILIASLLSWHFSK